MLLSLTLRVLLTLVHGNPRVREGSAERVFEFSYRFVLVGRPVFAGCRFGAQMHLTRPPEISDELRLETLDCTSLPA
jgi:hypothetical protein